MNGRIAASGKTRVCPHCKTVILESASRLPGLPTSPAIRPQGDGRARISLRFDPGDRSAPHANPHAVLIVVASLRHGLRAAGAPYPALCQTPRARPTRMRSRRARRFAVCCSERTARRTSTGPSTRPPPPAGRTCPSASCRARGLRLGDLDAKQAAAARTVFDAALSACGLELLDEVRLADDCLVPSTSDPSAGTAATTT